MLVARGELSKPLRAGWNSEANDAGIRAGANCPRKDRPSPLWASRMAIYEGFMGGLGRRPRESRQHRKLRHAVSTELAQKRFAMDA